MTKKMQRRLAMTLTEILVLITMIGILVLSAAPGFQHAQLRSKLAKVKSDFLIMGRAIEAYAVDRNAYPPCLSGGEYAQGFPFRLHYLSTPVAYIDHVIADDPFRPPTVDNNRDVAYIASYEYYDVNGAHVRGGGDIALLVAFEICAGRP